MIKKRDAVSSSSSCNPSVSFRLDQAASGVEWDQIFTPQKGWSKASKVEANDKNLIVKADGEATFFTNAALPKKAGYLSTVGQFGDCTVEAEFMIPKGSNSGIYLMGRYEIQILDSHGKDKVGYGDMGGVYRRWDNRRKPPGFEGVALKPTSPIQQASGSKWLSSFVLPA